MSKMTNILSSDVISNRPEFLDKSLYTHTLGNQVIADNDLDLCVLVDEVQIRGRSWAANVESIPSWRCTIGLNGEVILTTLVVQGVFYDDVKRLVDEICDTRNQYTYQAQLLEKLKNNIFDFANENVGGGSLTQNMFMRGYRMGERAGIQAYHDTIQLSCKEALKNLQRQR